MSENKENVPKIRFPGFDGGWERRAFSDFATRVSKSSDKNILPRIEYEDIVSGQGKLNKDIFAKESDKKGIEFAPGDTLFGKLRPYLQNWFLADFQGIAVGDWWVLRPNEIDSKFIYSLIQTNKYQTVANLSTGTKMPRSDWKVVSQTKFAIPTDMDEQSKIGQFFSSLDSLITLHQRKLNNVQNLKAGLLQKMFSKNGEAFPEVRFPGFTDPWEQRRFKDLLDSADGIRRGPFGSALKKDFFVPESDYVVYEQQNVIYDRFDTRYNITKEKYDELHRFKVNTGDFIMSGAGTIGRISRVPEGIKDGVFNQALIRMKINPKITASEFFLQWMRSDDMQRKLTEANPASAMVNLVPMSEVKEWDVMVPEKAEQAKIGEFFATLDSLITLHQRKLGHLQQQKKSLLQQMFV